MPKLSIACWANFAVSPRAFMACAVSCSVSACLAAGSVSVPIFAEVSVAAW